MNSIRYPKTLTNKNGEVIISFQLLTWKVKERMHRLTVIRKCVEIKHRSIYNLTKYYITKELIKNRKN